jgi:hypothetical protein
MLVRSISFLALTLVASAQNAPWSTPLRGSWVRAGAATQSDVTLASPSGAADIVISKDEASYVRQAAEFLAGDIERISGRRPAVVNAPVAGHVSIRLVTLGRGEAPPAVVNASSIQGQWESYRIVTQPSAVWLVGSNPRGTAFAAYTLAERLGIDPLYIWSGYRPEHHDPLILKSTDFTQYPPAFRYRGFFHDDEDLLPRPFDANGYPLQTGDVPLDWYKRFFETALRLRMNMVAPYVRVHRRYEVQKLASDWGLYYTSHHYDILVSNPFGLERFGLAAERGVRPDWNWFTNRDGMLKFWRGGVIENKELDVIWPVGMRGTEDRPFTFPQGTTPEKRAETFREVIREQVAITKDVVPKDKPPLFHFTMYNEMLPAYQANPAAFDLPEDVMIIWPDDNDGHMRGLPYGLGKWKHGVYYHLAYLGGRLSKQLTHVVNPKTVAEQFDKIVKSGATEYMLVNVSELRDYVMTARMLADITWDAPKIFASDGAAYRYTQWWSQEYFGNAPAEDAYLKYFSLLDAPGKFWTAPDAVEDLVDLLYKKVGGENVAPYAADKVEQLRKSNVELNGGLGLAVAVRNRLPFSKQQFFTSDVMLGLKVAARQTQAALRLEEALRAPDASEMWNSVFAARDVLEEVETELRRGEYPPFDRWYQESWIRSALSFNNPHRPYNQVRAFIGSEGHGKLVRMGQR